MPLEAEDSYVADSTLSTSPQREASASPPIKRARNARLANLHGQHHGTLRSRSQAPLTMKSTTEEILKAIQMPRGLIGNPATLHMGIGGKTYKILTKQFAEVDSAPGPVRKTDEALQEGGIETIKDRARINVDRQYKVQASHRPTEKYSKTSTLGGPSGRGRPGFAGQYSASDPIINAFDSSQGEHIPHTSPTPAPIAGPSKPVFPEIPLLEDDDEELPSMLSETQIEHLKKHQPAARKAADDDDDDDLEVVDSSRAAALERLENQHATGIRPSKPTMGKGKKEEARAITKQKEDEWKAMGGSVHKEAESGVKSETFCPSLLLMRLALSKRVLNGRRGSKRSTVTRTARMGNTTRTRGSASPEPDAMDEDEEEENKENADGDVAMEDEEEEETLVEDLNRARMSDLEQVVAVSSPPTMRTRRLSKTRQRLAQGQDNPSLH
ncbi:hypothetical protein FA13DRAFT_1807734 [Coprinellus micaceus]|uniref:Uncharacterized protein n=1 Tax=Coprinellus micaceus TaxID=71717 RepID=A0A4Y7R4P3_COPMI|nr:hypothetical protein FA13DRAFT_1807734 [Coprinellus micaceus]